MRWITHRMAAFLAVALLPFVGRAQYALGISAGPYAGIRGMLVNPAAGAETKYKWELNVLSGDVLFANSFVYVPKGAVPAFGFQSIIKGIIHADKFGTYYEPGNPYKRYNLTLSAEILGPSFLLALPDRQSVGFSMAWRGSADIRDIPGATAQNAYDYLRNSALWNTSWSDHSTRLTGMSWLEYGFHYAAVLLDDGTDRWDAGITLKYVQGVAAAYARNTALDYRIEDTSHLLFSGHVDYGRTDYDTYRRIRNYGDLDHGHGFGADIGIRFVHAHAYSIGLSLMDIGSIHFNRNAAAFHLQTTQADFTQFGQAHLHTNLAVDRALSAVFFHGDSSRSQIDNGFRMALPTALSLQAEGQLQEHVYWNATIVKGFHHGQGAVQPDIYSVTPRYEQPWWGVGVPLSLLYYGQWRARVGLAARLWYVYFGGDAPFSLLALGRMKGVDFYMGARFFILK